MDICMHTLFTCKISQIKDNLALGDDPKEHQLLQNCTSIVALDWSTGISYSLTSPTSYETNKKYGQTFHTLK